jgi:hypothetical protein
MTILTFYHAVVAALIILIGRYNTTHYFTVSQLFTILKKQKFH